MRTIPGEARPNNDPRTPAGAFDFETELHLAAFGSAAFQGEPGEVRSGTLNDPSTPAGARAFLDGFEQQARPE
jgi:hypothetical protein